MDKRITFDCGRMFYSHIKSYIKKKKTQNTRKINILFCGMGVVYIFFCRMCAKVFIVYPLLFISDDQKLRKPEVRSVCVTLEACPLTNLAHFALTKTNTLHHTANSDCLNPPSYHSSPSS